MQVIEQPWTSQSQLLDHGWQPLPTLPWLLSEDLCLCLGQKKLTGEQKHTLQLAWWLLCSTHMGTHATHVCTHAQAH